MRMAINEVPVLVPVVGLWLVDSPVSHKAAKIIWSAIEVGR